MKLAVCSLFTVWAILFRLVRKIVCEVKPSFSSSLQFIFNNCFSGVNTLYRHTGKCLQLKCVCTNQTRILFCYQFNVPLAIFNNIETQRIQLYVRTLRFNWTDMYRNCSAIDCLPLQFHQNLWSVVVLMLIAKIGRLGYHKTTQNKYDWYH